MYPLIILLGITFIFGEFMIYSSVFSNRQFFSSVPTYYRAYIASIINVILLFSIYMLMYVSSDNFIALFSYYLQPWAIISQMAIIMWTAKIITNSIESCVKFASRSHADEHWGLCKCTLRNKTILLMAESFIDHQGQEDFSLSCYRHQLCNQEHKDCWMAIPTESDNIPFDFDKTTEVLMREGLTFLDGLDSPALIAKSDLGDAEKLNLLLDVKLLITKNLFPYYNKEILRKINSSIDTLQQAAAFDKMEARHNTQASE